MASHRVASIEDVPADSMKHVDAGTTPVCLAHAEDGLIEAVEDPSRRFALGVLWHPEAGEDMKLFEALVAEAARYRKERRA